MTKPKEYPEGFDVTKHDAYVAAGGCPSVDHKTWCLGRAGHGGSHWSRQIMYGVREKFTRWVKM